MKEIHVLSVLKFYDGRSHDDFVVRSSFIIKRSNSRMTHSLEFSVCSS